MIALLDATTLIALFDAAHVHHQRPHQWLRQHRAQGWATCPLTQNACIRIISQPAYPGRLPVADITRRLGRAIGAPDHHFWPDSLSLCDPALFALEKVLTPKPLTDVYLLAVVGVPGQIVKRSKPHTAQDAPDLNHAQLPDMVAGQLIALTARIEALERQARAQPIEVSTFHAAETKIDQTT